MANEIDGKDEDAAVLKWVLRACVGAVLVVVGVVGAYVYNFGSWSLSSQTSDWGQFGDYLGGTLNPFLGLFSVVLLALTLRAQHRVLRETKQQSESAQKQTKLAELQSERAEQRRVLEEVQRLLSDCARDLDAALQRRLPGGDDLFAVFKHLEGTLAVAKWRAPDGAPTVHSLIAATLAEILAGGLSEWKGEKYWGHAELHWVFEKVAHLDRCLREFAERGGDSSIATLYGSIPQIADAARLLCLLQRIGVVGREQYGCAEETVKRLGIDGGLAKYEDGVAKSYASLHRDLHRDLDR